MNSAFFVRIDTVTAPHALPLTPPRSFVSGEQLETVMEGGQISWARWFSWFMDINGYSHPQLVAICKVCTGGHAWMHSSTIANMRNARTKNPGPRAFAALEYCLRDIDAAQRGEFITNFGSLTHLIQTATLMRDEEGNPATAGYMIEVFLGLRPIPIDLSVVVFSPTDAELISGKAARLIRKLMVGCDLDPLDDAIDLGGKFPGNPQQKQVAIELIKGQATWSPDEIEEQVGKLSKFCSLHFGYERTPQELLEELKK